MYTDDSFFDKDLYPKAYRIWDHFNYQQHPVVFKISDEYKQYLKFIEDYLSIDDRLNDGNDINRLILSNLNELFAYSDRVTPKYTSKFYAICIFYTLLMSGVDSQTNKQNSVLSHILSTMCNINSKYRMYSIENETLICENIYSISTNTTGLVYDAFNIGLHKASITEPYKIINLMGLIEFPYIDIEKDGIFNPLTGYSPKEIKWSGIQNNSINTDEMISPERFFSAEIYPYTHKLFYRLAGHHEVLRINEHYLKYQRIINAYVREFFSRDSKLDLQCAGNLGYIVSQLYVLKNSSLYQKCMAIVIFYTLIIKNEDKYEDTLHYILDWITKPFNESASHQNRIYLFDNKDYICGNIHYMYNNLTTNFYSGFVIDLVRNADNDNAIIHLNLWNLAELKYRLASAEDKSMTDNIGTEEAIPVHAYFEPSSAILELRETYKDDYVVLSILTAYEEIIKNANFEITQLNNKITQWQEFLGQKSPEVSTKVNQESSVIFQKYEPEQLREDLKLYGVPHADNIVSAIQVQQARISQLNHELANVSSNTSPKELKKYEWFFTGDKNTKITSLTLEFNTTTLTYHIVYTIENSNGSSSTRQYHELFHTRKEANECYKQLKAQLENNGTSLHFTAKESNLSRPTSSDQTSDEVPRDSIDHRLYAQLAILQNGITALGRTMPGPEKDNTLRIMQAALNAIVNIQKLSFKPVFVPNELAIVDTSEYSIICTYVNNLKELLYIPIEELSLANRIAQIELIIKALYSLLNKED